MIRLICRLFLFVLFIGLLQNIFDLCTEMREDSNTIIRLMGYLLDIAVSFFLILVILHFLL